MNTRLKNEVIKLKRDIVIIKQASDDIKNLMAGEWK